LAGTGEGKWFNGCRLSLLQDEGNSGGWLHNSVNAVVLNMTEIYIFKNGEDTI
jgi:hypothetical protein